MMKKLYAIYYPFAETMEEPFTETTDEMAKMRFVNTYFQMKENFEKQKKRYPINQIQLIKLAEFDESSFVDKVTSGVGPTLPVFNPVLSLVMEGKDCPMYDEDMEGDENEKQDN